MITVDIPDYIVDPSPDGKEWIKRKALAARWELRRVIEEAEFIAEQYQMKEKYGGNGEDLAKLESELKRLLEQSQELAIQIRDLA